MSYVFWKIEDSFLIFLCFWFKYLLNGALTLIYFFSIFQVFREEIAKLTQERADLETLFSNITDIYEFTVTLFGSLEDVMEITEESQIPMVGFCFEELAEAAEFDVYIKSVSSVISINFLQKTFHFSKLNHFKTFLIQN